MRLNATGYKLTDEYDLVKLESASGNQSGNLDHVGQPEDVLIVFGFHRDVVELIVVSRTNAIPLPASGIAWAVAKYSPRREIWADTYGVQAARDFALLYIEKHKEVTAL